jgi:hypothetical protein
LAGEDGMFPIKKTHRFLATVYKIWMMRHIDVPEEVSTALMKEMGKAGANGSTGPNARRNDSKRGRAAAGGQARHGRGNQAARKDAEHGRPAASEVKPKYIPVTAVVNKRTARTTLVPAGGGRFRMQINTALRKAAHVDAGDSISVELRLDLESRELPVPRDLREGLKAIPKARKAFEALTPAHRRHFIQWFDSAKSTDARQRRLERSLDVLLERALLKPRKTR